MSSQRRKPRKKPRILSAGAGAPPGTLVVDPNAAQPVIRVMAYGPEGLVEEAVQAPDGLRRFLEKWPVTWVNVDGLGDAETLVKLGEIFGLHRLALEDIVSVDQRPKVEQYEEFQLIVIRMPWRQERLETEQVSLFLGKRFVLTFQERVGDCLDPVRQRIRAASGRIRQAGPDYLAYSLIDAITDGYFPVLEDFGEKLEALEDEVVERPDSATVSRIHQVKRDLLTLRRAVWPLREAVNSLFRDSTPLVSDETRIYLRDCYDHVVQILELLETYRELGSGMIDVYLSSMSNRMNEIMKVLTIIATIFIPLTFIAGVYGMNFSREASPWNMPELHWYYGYEFALGLMLIIAIVMMIYFLRKGWLGGSRSRRAPASQPPGEESREPSP